MSSSWRDNKIIRSLAPYQDVILFVIALLCANYFWKFTIVADEHGGPVHWFGWDISAPFDFLSAHVAKVSYWLIHLFRDTVHYYEPYYIHFDTGNGVSIVWSCTGLKQSFIWIVIMLVARGSWKRKAWFIPLGLVCIYAFNILRITIIAMIVEHHVELFDLFHAYIFKYLFYFMLFMLWVWWAERLSINK